MTYYPTTIATLIRTDVPTIMTTTTTMTTTSFAHIDDDDKSADNDAHTHLEQVHLLW